MSGLARYLNALAPAAARAALGRCCAAEAWVDGMLARRPFADRQAVLAAADGVWRGLDADHWRQAFAAHPRIGERAGGWSRREQRGMDGTGAELRDALRAGNRAYEARFGHVFLICASGLDAATMLAELRRRLTNDPASELAEAAAEQAKITRLRLARLAAEAAAQPPSEAPP